MNSYEYPASAKNAPCSLTSGATVARLGNLVVELSTAQGCVFDGPVSGMEVELASGDFDLRTPEVTYFRTMKVTVLVLHDGARTCAFRLENASASLRGGKLTVLAERIEPAIVL